MMISALADASCPKMHVNERQQSAPARSCSCTACIGSTGECEVNPPAAGLTLSLPNRELHAVQLWQRAEGPQ